MEEEKPVIFVIDDNPSVRTSLSRLLLSMGFFVETFASAGEFMERGEFDRGGCIVLDVRMPGLSGLDLQDVLAGADYSMPIVFITGHGDISTSVRAMKKGAVDFLTKPFDDEDLLEAVKSALEKNKKVRQKQAEMREIRDRMEQLTPRQQEILRYVITGMLNKQIAYKLNISEKTVKVHRGNVMEKLGVGSIADLVRLAGKAGIEPPTQSL
ncbi:MAG TPA: response regulator transcription factor [Syntrophorhabdaceae bacterium]|jgi:FixJ family two-component response regulator